jgi:hypothetical protein
VAKAAEAGVSAIVELVDEKPAQALLDSADKHDARLTVWDTDAVDTPSSAAMAASVGLRCLVFTRRQ